MLNVILGTTVFLSNLALSGFVKHSKSLHKTENITLTVTFGIRKFDRKMGNWQRSG